MKSRTMILCLIAATMMIACEQREQAGVATQSRTEREGQVAGESTQQPAISDQQATATQQQQADREAAGTPGTAMPPGDITSRTEPSEGQSGSRPSPSTPSGVQTDSRTATQGAQPGASESQPAAGSRQSSEFYGQSPQFGNAPETIILKASNGNVTLSHKKHAGMMDCKSCHGDGTPGPIEGFNKDQAHSLCTGCHKEKGAGPTKCQECHKKQ